MNVDAADKLRRQAIAPWAIKANRAIKTRIEDARAHAERSLGRARYPGQSRIQVETALQRLWELQECLVGSGPESTRGIVQDARADFYRRAFGSWSIMIPPECLDPRVGSTRHNEDVCRKLTLFGLTLLAEVSPAFLSAENSLRTTLHAADRMEPTQQRESLDLWENKARNAIQSKIEGMLSDSEVAITEMVGQSMIRVEMRAARGKRGGTPE